MTDKKIATADSASGRTSPALSIMLTHRRLGQLVLVVVEGLDRGMQHLIEVCRGRIVKGGRSATNVGWVGFWGLTCVVRPRNPGHPSRKSP